MVENAEKLMPAVVSIINPKTNKFIGKADVLQASHGYAALKSYVGVVRYFNLTTGLSIPADKLKIEDRDLEVLREEAGYYING